MYIDQYKKEDGYYDSDNYYYEDAESLISTGILGFCGCGNPEEATEYVRRSLELINNLKEEVWEDKVTYEDWRKEVDAHFGSSGAEYFMWYFLDNKGLTEHGGSVTGWLSVEGVELLSDLNELKESEE
jgi:hypothetical protein